MAALSLSSVPSPSPGPGHILMFHPWNTRSHRIQQNALLEALLARGHRVIGVFGQASDIASSNYTEIVVSNGCANYWPTRPRPYN